MIADDFQIPFVDEFVNDPARLTFADVDLLGDSGYRGIDIQSSVVAPVSQRKHCQLLASAAIKEIPHEGHHLDAHVIRALWLPLGSADLNFIQHLRHYRRSKVDATADLLTRRIEFRCHLPVLPQTQSEPINGAIQ
jgi:hypothetical protein